MTRKLTLLLIFTLALIALSACGGGVYVRVPPPEPRYAVVGVAPGPGFVWTEGFWDWRGGNWAWVQGRWMRPPGPRAVWVPGRWVQGPGGRYRFVRGHWRR
jgi:hypothetical protein